MTTQEGPEFHNLPSHVANCNSIGSFELTAKVFPDSAVLAHWEGEKKKEGDEGGTE